MVDSTRLSSARMCRRPAQKGAGWRSPGRSREGLDQERSQDRSDGYPISFDLPTVKQATAAASKCSSTSVRRRSRAVVGDKGYDAKTIGRRRVTVTLSGDPLSLEHHHKPKFSQRSSTSAGAYRANHGQDQALQTHRAPLREDGKKLASLLALVCGLILIKSVHTA